jgi:RimJ/RimL family protein N-acetyltransferase
MNKRVIKTDKSGESFEIGRCDAADLSLLLEMYSNFSPKPASQGLPPPDNETCHNWVIKLFEMGMNFLAWKNGKVIAHTALIPDPKEKAVEFIVFVDQNYRNLRIGTELTWSTLEEAKALGFQSVWLSVETSNFVAIKLYRNFGFQFFDMDSCERIMLLKFSRKNLR